MPEKFLTQTLKVYLGFNLCSSFFKLALNRMRLSFMLLDIINAVAGRFIVLAVNFTATTLITRILSVEDRGKYAILINLINLFMVLYAFGFHSSIVYKLSNNYRIFSSLYIISFFVSLLASCLILLFSFSGISEFFFPRT